eukprot:3185855-Pyramimonas_sp.AAC.1
MPPSPCRSARYLLLWGLLKMALPMATCVHARRSSRSLREKPSISPWARFWEACPMHQLRRPS